MRTNRDNLSELLKLREQMVRVRGGSGTMLQVRLDQCIAQVDEEIADAEEEVAEELETARLQAQERASEKRLGGGGRGI